jgi:hypothetical protein
LANPTKRLSGIASEAFHAWEILEVFLGVLLNILGEFAFKFVDQGWQYPN